ncbi:putative cell wall glucanase protein [Phaeoacremonium minimum UCRPA7]|uniref:Crh-like protein n=1 Tax=Phaeoacremonium minimum (strain UCR-PA7) TaxID=1286976 RepID=R8BUA0_PHAM7|nr:putative cell wall glucanase protein [Phaeoacremonium minimum UCRPA7]EOO02869.1 putative cell wall glucanase protein [Phaeoacremonium minimum UCRPA7]
MRSFLPLGAALLGASTVLAADQAQCSLDKKCPKETPCCSQYGQCGVGAYCLGGCDPRMSFSLDSCVPAPVCQDKTYKMDSLDKVVDVGKYLGDASKADWVSQGEPLLYNGNVLLTMPKESVGTVLATTDYLWYGNVKGRIKTSHGAGVVTAFILLSDVKDEIDYEWVGTELEIAQTNYYFQGIPSYVNSGNISLSNTFDNFHDYEIKWTPDSITWLVDGQVGRTKKKSETWNETAQQWDFPQTPSRLQISIWPGGAASNAQGTIDWAGGLIDWDSDDIKNHGYYYATFGEITVECYNADKAPGTNKGVSYTYDDAKATNDTVVDGDKPTVLKSFLGTGLDMDAGASSASSSASGSSTATGSSGPVASIPGGTAQGPGTNGEAAGGGTSGDGSSSGSGTTTSPDCQQTGFTQNCGSGSSSGSSGSNSGAGRIAPSQDRILGASAFAVVVAFIGLMWL